ncbi:S-adenosyl-L-methionine-dependent methyltransferase [Cercophora newfieldiana]|uniref:S-adenosyl-L-methionine-dependent methyltransferase n=1 Tax=Cercophora newfieldiana TaxID=92897 RepID=A0AA39YM33_9PEZI|nr:S-adenosyl-L-methionine-dependent methyltransferase [Cercophora newfieldiana]
MTVTQTTTTTMTQPVLDLPKSDKSQYDQPAAVAYTSYADLPVARLEAELIHKALGDCTNLNVLDLGGGSGTYARMALSLGASRIDVVDISPSMLSLGQSLSPLPSQITYHLADATQTLPPQNLPLLPPGSYDLVMANWLFDHAHSPSELRAMWSNIATYLRRDGKFIGIRAIAPGMFSSHNCKVGKYGCLRSEIRAIPGGVACRATLLTSPPLEVGCTLMEDCYSLRDEIGREAGMVGFGRVEERGTRVVREDVEFWREHLEEPEFAVVTAVRG